MFRGITQLSFENWKEDLVLDMSSSRKHIIM